MRQIILQTVNIAVKLVNIITPLLFALRRPLRFNLKLIPLHSHSGELLSHFVELGVDLVSALVLRSDPIFLSLHEHLFFDIKLLGSVCQQCDFIL